MSKIMWINVEIIIISALIHNYVLYCYRLSAVMCAVPANLILFFYRVLQTLIAASIKIILLYTTQKKNPIQVYKSFLGGEGLKKLSAGSKQVGRDIQHLQL